MKDLDEYILTVPFMLLLEEVRFLAFRDGKRGSEGFFNWNLITYLTESSVHIK